MAAPPLVEVVTGIAGEPLGAALPLVEVEIGAAAAAPPVAEVVVVGAAVAPAECSGLTCRVTWIVRRIVCVRTSGVLAAAGCGGRSPGLELSATPARPPSPTIVAAAASFVFTLLCTVTSSTTSFAVAS
jgi:hypothetical protein